MKILEKIDKHIVILSEGKKTLPPHLQDLIKKIKKNEKDLKKFGFTIKDVTPKGYGPNEASKTPSTQMECIECGRKFKKKLGKNTFEVKCPKCGSYDTEPV